MYMQTQDVRKRSVPCACVLVSPLYYKPSVKVEFCRLKLANDFDRRVDAREKSCHPVEEIAMHPNIETR